MSENILAVCVCEGFGMVFNNRRVSRDRAVCQDMLDLCNGGCLHVSANTLLLFDGLDTGKVSVKNMDEDVNADGTHLYFVENPQKIPGIKWDKVVIYNWNRKYPFDKKLEINMDEFNLIDEVEFKGNSHEKITRQIFG